VVGEAKTNEDVLAWANIVDETWVLAGAGDFYTALLEKKHTAKPQQKMELLSPHLYVCGTAYEERKQFINSLDCCLYMQDDNNEALLQQASVIFKEQKRLVIAINESNQTALELRTAMAKLVSEIVVRENVPEIFIEGGSTAAAILEALNIKKLIPVNELSRGVVRMKAGDLFITVKPGSYELPEEIKNIYISHR
jgi:D-threonate/D-erythronate kinase